MTQEEIERAAVDSCVFERDIFNPELTPYYEQGFKDGANWRIDSVWHDVDKELPKYNRHVVNEDWFDFIAKDEKDLKRIMNQYPYKRWAYVDDLKPNMED